MRNQCDVFGSEGSQRCVANHSTRNKKSDESGIRTHALSDQMSQLSALVWRLRPLGHLTMQPQEP